MPTIGTARLAKNMGIDNFKMYLIENFCISLTLILYLNKFTNELNILHGSFKNWDNKTWLSSQKYIKSFNRFILKQVKLNRNSRILDIGW